jgi:hypothetical protein
VKAAFLAFLGVSAFAADDALLFSFFRNNGEDGLYLATSGDGLNWRPLHSDRPLVRPEVGESKLMRDPSILRGPGGVFITWGTTASAPARARCSRALAAGSGGSVPTAPASNGSSAAASTTASRSSSPRPAKPSGP